jgi:uncharacterized protein (TIGR02145 family)
MKIAKSILLLLLVLTIVNCSNSEDGNNNSNPDSNFTENFGNLANRDFIGQIVDENNQALEGVEVKIGSISKTTDSKGVFVIKNAAVYEKFAYITAKKSGFINGSRTIVPNTGTNTIKIMMLSAIVQATVASGTASNVALSNGSKVTFDGNFKTESGTAYSGSVKVMMHHLDPSDATTRDKMPGSLMAQNAAGSQRILETYGMMNVELQDASGNKLQIANTSSIEMPISSSQAATAPSTIPLWYFDETAGYWKEEGSATKVGNKYIGTVNHFSWWNCDVQFPTVSLGITVVNSNQDPMAGVRVELVRNNQNGGWNVPGYTNVVGQVSGLVPANETLTMNIYSNNTVCGNQVVYTQQIGPFSSNTALPIVVIPASSLNTTIVQGTLTNCSNASVTNGYVWLQTAGQFLYTQVTNGSFSFSVLNCSSAATSFTLQGFDLDTMKLTTQQTGIINNQTVSLGVLQACITTNNPTGEFLDIDQNLYTYLPIGQQTWMQQNLNVSRYSDGTVIPQVSEQALWSGLYTGAWCYYGNNPANGAEYGKLYNWYAVAGIYDTASFNDPSLRKQLAPTGWHVPTDAEWTTLTNYLGGENVAGAKMKETGNTHWVNNPLGTNSIGTNSSGFTGLPGGYRGSSIDGNFFYYGNSGYWWSSSEDAPSFGSWYRYIDSGTSKVYRYPNGDRTGYSVRCIKD